MGSTRLQDSSSRLARGRVVNPHSRIVPPTSAPRSRHAPSALSRLREKYESQQRASRNPARNNTFKTSEPPASATGTVKSLWKRLAKTDAKLERIGGKLEASRRAMEATRWRTRNPLSALPSKSAGTIPERSALHRRGRSILGGKPNLKHRRAFRVLYGRRSLAIAAGSSEREANASSSKSKARELL